MYFQKEHDLALEYFLNFDENFGFMDNASTNETNYYVSFKKMTKSSMEMWRLKNFENFLPITI